MATTAVVGLCALPEIAKPEFITECENTAVAVQASRIGSGDLFTRSKRGRNHQPMNHSLQG